MATANGSGLTGWRTVWTLPPPATSGAMTSNTSAHRRVTVPMAGADGGAAPPIPPSLGRAVLTRVPPTARRRSHRRCHRPCRRSRRDVRVDAANGAGIAAAATPPPNSTLTTPYGHQRDSVTAGSRWGTACGRPPARGAPTSTRSIRRAAHQDAADAVMHL